MAVSSRPSSAAGHGIRGALHGGAPAALLMREFEQLPAADGLSVARVTYEFMRPVPVGPLELNAQVVRPGRRVQLLEALDLSPTESRSSGLARSRSRSRPRVRTAPPRTPRRHRGPSTGGRPSFIRHIARCSPSTRSRSCSYAGAWGGGPSTAWFRLRSPIVAGETPSPLQRLAAAGDFGNGISSILSWDDYLYINPDLTLYVEREPVGEWICLESETRIAADGHRFGRKRSL